MATGHDLKLLIKGRGYSATEAAPLLGVSRQTLQGYFNQARVDDSYLQLVRDKLPVKTGDEQESSGLPKNKTGESGPNLPDQLTNITTNTDKNQLSNKEDNINITPRLENGSVVESAGGVLWVPFVSIPARAGYMSAWMDEEFIESLEKKPFMIQADKTYRGTYRAFAVSGDSMMDGSINSFKAGDTVLGREIPRDLWRDKLHLHKWETYIVIHKLEGILIKNIASHDKGSGIITLHSLNPVFRDFELNLDDVLQLYNVVQIFRDLSNPAM